LEDPDRTTASKLKRFSTLIISDPDPDPEDQIISDPGGSGSGTLLSTKRIPDG